MADLIVTVALIGWGLITFGAVTHIWHYDNLRRLLAMHVAKPDAAAAMLVATETAVAMAIPVGMFGSSTFRVTGSATGVVLGVAFTVWIARLLITGSDLPCACSFSDAPTTIWSLARAACVIASGLPLLVSGAHIAALDAAETFTAHAVGLAVAGAIYTLPEAVSWPRASTALLARAEAHSRDTMSATSPSR